MATISYLQARWYTPADTRAIRLLCLHDVEVAEKPDTAEGVANLFHTWDRKASAHEVIDSNSIVVCVHDKDIAYAAAGANHDGKHYELAGYASQTADQWQDAYGAVMLPIAARRVAEDCVRYNIPPVRLTVAQVRDGKTKGITHHKDVEAAFPSTGHHDVGDNFPWDYFLALVRAEIALIVNPSTNQEDDMDRTCIPSWAKRQTNGRMPFYKLDPAPELAPTAVRVLAFAGCPLKAGLPAPTFKYGSVFGIPCLEVRPGGASVVGIEEHTTSGAVLLCLSDGGTLDIGAKP